MINNHSRAYPLQILIWHEIVNDTVAGVPVSITFCPLCYCANVFDRRVDGRSYNFRVSGMLRYSDMVMYDRQTESLWQQISGEAIVGDMVGSQLRRIPAQIISFEQFRSAHKQGLVLSRKTGFRRNYGQNPYAGYDDISKSPFMYRGEKDGRLYDEQTTSVWDITGRAVQGPLRGKELTRIVHGDYFAFAWLAFKPETEVFR